MSSWMSIGKLSIVRVTARTNAGRPQENSAYHLNLGCLNPRHSLGFLIGPDSLTFLKALKMSIDIALSQNMDDK